MRGLSPWPVAQTVFRGKTLKIHKTSVAKDVSGVSGELLQKDGRYYAACGEGAVELLEVQAEGSKRMAAADFFRGHPAEAGERLGDKS